MVISSLGSKSSINSTLYSSPLFLLSKASRYNLANFQYLRRWFIQFKFVTSFVLTERLLSFKLMKQVSIITVLTFVGTLNCQTNISDRPTISPAEGLKLHENPNYIFLDIRTFKEHNEKAITNHHIVHVVFGIM